MSARLKLKRINDRINGVMKMAQKALYERDEIHRRFIANTVTLWIETNIDEIALVRYTGHYIDYVTKELAYQLSVKFGEALAEYIRLNLNISDIQNFPDNRIKVELIAPRMNEKNVRIITAKNRHDRYNDWRKI
jgi:hypothetical protein